MTFLENMAIRLKCPQCQGEFIETFTWLKQRGKYCRGCGAQLHGQAIASALMEVEDSIARVRRAFRSASKRDDAPEAGSTSTSASSARRN
jgi:hypothetical protein